MPKPTHNAARATQDDIVIGNLENKADLRNPLARWMVGNFDRRLLELLDACAPRSLHEVGCGEGRLTEKLAARYTVAVRGTDFSRELIDALRASQVAGSRIQYVERSIYELDPTEDAADTLVCCEVLEHLERPAEALARLRSLGARHYLFSVPREPLWRVLNMARGKYWSALGNTPGHLQHWSARAFVAALEAAGFEILERRQPLPWTMVRARLRQKPI
jgi:SAM-dependent methyltransferase